MENIEYISVAIVIFGEDRVEVSQHWETPASQMFDHIADAVVAFSNKHGVAIDRVIVRPIDS